MAQVFSTILALVVGLVLWRLSFAASGGAYPFGRAGLLEVILFFAPIVAVVIPSALDSFDAESISKGLWKLALAPIVGVLNFVPLFLLYAPARAFFEESVALYLSAAVNVGVWAIVLFLTRRSPAPPQIDGSSAEDPSANPPRRPNRR